MNSKFVDVIVRLKTALEFPTEEGGTLVFGAGSFAAQVMLHFAGMGDEEEGQEEDEDEEDEMDDDEEETADGPPDKEVRCVMRVMDGKGIVWESETPLPEPPPLPDDGDLYDEAPQEWKRAIEATPLISGIEQYDDGGHEYEVRIGNREIEIYMQHQCFVFDLGFLPSQQCFLVRTSGLRHLYWTADVDPTLEDAGPLPATIARLSPAALLFADSSIQCAADNIWTLDDEESPRELEFRRIENAAGLKPQATVSHAD